MKVWVLRDVPVRRWGVLPVVSRHAISFFIMKSKTGELALLDPLDGREVVRSNRRVLLNQQRHVTSQKTTILVCKLRTDLAACIKWRCTFK